MSKQPSMKSASFKKSDSEQSQIAAGYFDVYREHSNTLRAWLVGYGVGVPVLILSQDLLWKVLIANRALAEVALYFLGGTVLQALLAFVNKYAMWPLYYGSENREYQSRTAYKVAAWISGQWWVDLLLDAVSILAFALGTFAVFESLSSLGR